MGGKMGGKPERMEIFGRVDNPWFQPLRYETSDLPRRCHYLHPQWIVQMMGSDLKPGQLRGWFLEAHRY